MYLWELFIHILRGMQQRKLRSLLALFGIVWGTVAVVMLLALGQGFYLHNKKSMASLTSGAIMGQPGQTSKAYLGLPQRRAIHLKASDIVNLPKHIAGIRATSPLLGMWQQRAVLVYHDQHTRHTPISGVAANYAKLANLPLQHSGRFINPLDSKQHSAVVVLGYKLKQRLFKQHAAVGETITLQGIPFKVIGVLKNADQTQWLSHFAFIPYTTYIDLFGNQVIAQFVIMPDDINNSTTLQKEILGYFSVRYQFAPDDKQAIHFFDFNKIAQFFMWFFRCVQIFLGFCGSLTLAVGGVSVANIMFLIVTERTREIGLRMALGARDGHIMLQIMLESVMIVFMGGLGGIVLSWLGVSLLQLMTLPNWLGTPRISVMSAVATFIILAIVAILAGFFPARRAIKMQPVVALGS